MNKDEVLGVVKQWITLDDEIKQLQKLNSAIKKTFMEGVLKKH